MASRKLKILSSRYFLSDKYCHAIATTADDKLESSLRCAAFPTGRFSKIFNGCFKRNDEEDYYCELEKLKDSGKSLGKIGSGKTLFKRRQKRSNKDEDLGICSNSCPKHAGKQMIYKIDCPYHEQ